MSNIKHSSASDEWYTPALIVDLAHQVLGNIDLDPASSNLANETIEAARFIDVFEDGLTTEWPSGCTVFCNPPGEKRSGKSIAALFWQKMMEYREAGHLSHAIFIGFSIEQLAVSQSYHSKCMIDFPFCIPKSRIKFKSPYATKKSPSHNNVIIYVPGKYDNTEGFVEAFEHMGRVKV